LLVAETTIVAVVFTDLEGSTEKWGAYGAEMSDALELHDSLAQTAFGKHFPSSLKHTGDGHMAVFSDIEKAIQSASDLVLAMRSADWPVPEPLILRVGIHVGAAYRRDGDWFGSAVSRAARICDMAQGGQILLSHAAQLAGADRPNPYQSREVGLVQLRGLARPEKLFQLLGDDLRDDFQESRSGFLVAPNNLPVSLTDFLGREAEVASGTEALGKHRLVTLVGPGGVGKTRLAIEVGNELLSEFPDGVWFLDLSAISDSHDVPSLAASVLALPEDPTRTPLSVVTDWARSKQCLLIFDNCEHLLDQAADVIEAFLAGSPRSKALATSRELLHIPGEFLAQVRPFSGSNTASQAAVQLFRNRAEALSDLDLAEHHDAIFELCEKLDGLPLAIELAAAHTVTMSPEEILEGLGSALDLKAKRRARGRHASLEAAIGWSYDLLSSEEKTVLQCVSVSENGMRQWVAPFVANRVGLSGEVFSETLGSLAERSLLMVQRPFGKPLYRLLDSVRAYASAKADEAGMRDAILDGWADSFAEACSSGFADTLEREPAVMLEMDSVLLSAVMAFRTLVARGRIDEAVGAHSELRPYFFHLGLETGIIMADILLSEELSPHQRVDVLSTLAVCQWLGSRHEEVTRTVAESLEVASTAGLMQHPLTLATAGLMAWDRSDSEGIVEEWQQSRDAASPWHDSPGLLQIPPPGLIWAGHTRVGRSVCRELVSEERKAGRLLTLVPLLNALSILERSHDRERSLALADEGLALAHENGGSWWTASLLLQRGYALSTLGRKEEALREAGRALDRGKEMSDFRVFASALESIAHFMLRADLSEPAALLSGAAVQIREDYSIPVYTTEVEARNKLVDALSRALGEGLDELSRQGRMAPIGEIEAMAAAFVEG
jgi:predicted ATPase/class 3 adenylate cyclase